MHFAFTDIASQIADGDWGREYETQHEAAKALIQDPNKLTAYCLTELLGRLNKLGRRNSRWDRGQREIEAPENPKTFPNKNVGDFLWGGSGSLLEPTYRQVIIAKDDEHHCLTVICDDFCTDWAPMARFADDEDFETLEEAIRYAAEKDLEYYGSYVKHAKKALAAIEANQDLEPFMEGIG